MRRSGLLKAIFDPAIEYGDLGITAQIGHTAPTVTIEQGVGQVDPTWDNDIVFDVEFSEPVTGFATGDVTLSGTAGATTAVVSGSGASYTVTVSGMDDFGTVTATIAAGVATSVATGAPNLASTSVDNTVTHDFDPLTIPDLAMWWDAGDSGSISHTSGNVNQWNDKSGNGFHMTGSGGTRPLTGTRSILGQNVIDFPDTARLTYSGNTGIDVDDVTIFLVVATDDNPNGGDGFLVFHSGAGDDWQRTDSLNIFSGNTSRRLQSERNSVASFTVGSGATPVATYWVIHNGGDIRAFINGAAGTATTSAGAGTTATGGILMGDRFLSGAPAGSFMDGYLAEVIVVADGAMSSTMIDYVYKYLDIKWF